jgi:hypothetical protein
VGWARLAAAAEGAAGGAARRLPAELIAGDGVGTGEWERRECAEVELGVPAVAGDVGFGFTREVIAQYANPLPLRRPD